MLCCLPGTNWIHLGKGPKIIFPEPETIRDPGQWNWKQSKTINIRILNTVVFQRFMNRVPPPCPISFENYINAGLPFLQFLAPWVSEDILTKPKSVGLIDVEKGMTMDVHLHRGKTIGCTVSGNNLTDYM
jgi:hypothetical protein